MKNTLYTKEYLELLLKQMAGDMNELSAWSAYNGDKALDQIVALKSQFSEVRTLLTSETK